MAEEVLQELWKLSKLIVSKPARRILMYHGIVGIIIISIFLVYLLHTFDGDIVIRYSTTFIACLYFTVMSLMLLRCGPKYKHLLEVKEQVFWSIVEHASESIRKRINFEMKLVIASSGVCFACINVMIITLLTLPREDFNNLVLIPKLSDLYIKDKYINWMIYALEREWLVFGFYNLLSCYSMMYFMIILRFQLYVLQNKIRALEHISNQDEIYDSMVVIIEKHAQLKQYTVLVQDITAGAGLIYGWTGLATNFAFASAVVLGGIELPLLVMINFAILMSLTTGFLIHSGQALEDNFEELFSVCCQTRWYEWDKRTKMAYKLLLMNSINVPKIFITLGVYLNYSSAIQAYKVIFTITNLLLTVAPKR